MKASFRGAVPSTRSWSDSRCCERRRAWPARTETAVRTCDEPMQPAFLTMVVSYLLGSIPFGFLLVRIFRGADIRQTGSGNIGATNVARTSPVLGIVTLLLAGFKGFGAVVIARNWIAPWSSTPSLVLAGLAALLAISGHT